MTIGCLKKLTKLINAGGINNLYLTKIVYASSFDLYIPQCHN